VESRTPANNPGNRGDDFAGGHAGWGNESDEFVHGCWHCETAPVEFKGIFQGGFQFYRERIAERTRVGDRFAAKTISHQKIGATGEPPFKIEPHHAIDFAAAAAAFSTPDLTTKQTSFHTLCGVSSISFQSLSDTAGTGYWRTRRQTRRPPGKNAPRLLHFRTLSGRIKFPMPSAKPETATVCQRGVTPRFSQVPVAFGMERADLRSK
jgi:hypothetical protein